MKLFRDTVRALWKWSLLVTGPAAVVALLWFSATAKQYYKFGLTFESAVTDTSLQTILELEAGRLKQLIQNKMSPTASKAVRLPAVRLYLPEAKESKLNTDLPYSGRNYVKAKLEYPDGRLRKVRARYRGNSALHWMNSKKSWRIKTKEDRLYQGLRHFNLILPKRPELLNNYLSYALAHELGLMVPRNELVFLFVNNQPRGIYLKSEQIEETTLRLNSRMPADLYAGELTVFEKPIGISQTLFRHAGLWRKVAINNHYDESHNEPLEELLRILRRPMDPASQERLSELLDMETWARFSAFESLANTYHFDRHHNWRLYYDPYRGVFEPIIWDPGGWGEWGGQEQEAIISSPLHEALFRNGDFLRERERCLQTFFSSGAAAKFLGLVREKAGVVTEAVQVDPEVVVNNRLFTPRRVQQAVERFVTRVENRFDYIHKNHFERTKRVTYRATEGGLGAELTLQDGVSVDEILLDVEGEITGLPGVSIEYETSQGRVTKDVSGAATVSGQTIRIRGPFLPAAWSVQFPNTILQQNQLILGPATYGVSLHSGINNGRLVDVRIVRRGQEESTTRNNASDWHLVPKVFRQVREVPLEQRTTWSGAVDVQGTVLVPEDLVILPGTRVRFGPEANLVIRGRLLAEGTATAPISFEPLAESNAPWGAVALVGSGANDSKIRHCTFYGGSGYKDSFQEFTAMFSVHAVRGLVVENTAFRSSRVTDDMVHLVYSKASFHNCEFESAFADALDADISEITMVESRFLGSGNDAIDLMTSTATVVSSQFIKSGDKGVSVGEGSTLRVLNAKFTDNQIAVQSKDGSTAVLYNVDFERNVLALDAYNKNWRYGVGGSILVDKSWLNNNKSVATADGKSLVKIFDSFVPEAGGASNETANPSKEVHTAPSVDAVGRAAAAPEALSSLEDGLDWADGIDGVTVVRDQRGAHGLDD